ncbi:aminopeptidase P family protein [uncultured Duncaniella sp.]|uniref:aminopeptidase P family protein n=1 Tax=uncultured Duncaniella sp. TaxID=2768039 RepID=UPI00265AE070|nr:aminopeptidase P family protein [uncultured Duncaniella sp.]
MTTNVSTQRIQALRDEMANAGLNAVIVPRTDPHLSEYISSHWHTVRYLTGFTGSAGTLVITADGAYLWVDSRYFLQGEDQTQGSGIVIMKDGLPETPSINRFLCDTLNEGDTVGINGMLMSLNDTATLRSALNKKGIRLDVNFDPIDRIWNDRPELPSDAAFIHDEKYAGKSASDKLADLRRDFTTEGARAFFTSALDEIAWLLNLRSTDVPCNPVATSFLYVGEKDACLFINPAKLTPEVIAYLSASGVATAPYNDALGFLTEVPRDIDVLLSGDRASGAVASALDGHFIISDSPVLIPKAVKNEVQMQGIRDAHVRDGVYMVRSIMEVKRTVEQGTPLTEIGVAEILERNRRTDPLFFDLSFDSICGFGPHGAIVHYSATPETDAQLHTDNLLLIDSGANYLDATTDITRTIALGTPSADMRHDFTLVMKGHIAIATAVFPEGTRGHQLDAMARISLWKEGKSYLHGTGHGVGHFLNVHEGPQSIRLNDTMAPLMPGMLTSNEPGVYLADRYGIRCQNLVLTIPYETTEFGNFYAFETVTMCPFDRDLFDTSIMTPEEIKWVDDYHRTVYDRLSPSLTPDEREWLAAATAPLK